MLNFMLIVTAVTQTSNIIIIWWLAVGIFWKIDGCIVHLEMQYQPWRKKTKTKTCLKDKFKDSKEITQSNIPSYFAVYHIYKISICAFKSWQNYLITDGNFTFEVEFFEWQCKRYPDDKIEKRHDKVSKSYTIPRTMINGWKWRSSFVNYRKLPIKRHVTNLIQFLS